MPMLECPVVFTMPLVGEGWTATAENNLTFFELATSKDAAVHIVCTTGGSLPRLGLARLGVVRQLRPVALDDRSSRRSMC